MNDAKTPRTKGFLLLIISNKQSKQTTSKTNKANKPNKAQMPSYKHIISIFVCAASILSHGNAENVISSDIGDHDALSLQQDQSGIVTTPTGSSTVIASEMKPRNLRGSGLGETSTNRKLCRPGPGGGCGGGSAPPVAAWTASQANLSCTTGWGCIAVGQGQDNVYDARVASTLHFTHMTFKVPFTWGHRRIVLSTDQNNVNEDGQIIMGFFPNGRLWLPGVSPDNSYNGENTFSLTYHSNIGQCFLSKQEKEGAPFIEIARWYVPTYTTLYAQMFFYELATSVHIVSPINN